MWECHGYDSQKWNYDLKAEAIYPYVTGPSMCMDIAHGKLTPGSKIVNYYCVFPYTSQMWLTGTAPAPPPPLPPSPTIPPCIGKSGRFVLNDLQSMCIDIESGDVKDGAIVQIWKCMENSGRIGNGAQTDELSVKLTKNTA